MSGGKLRLYSRSMEIMNNWTDAKDEAIDEKIAGQISEDYCDQGNFLMEWLKTRKVITIKLWPFQKNVNMAGD